MINSLMTYTGIDDIDNLDNYAFFKKYKVDGYIELDEEIDELLSFSVLKECINHKHIKGFDESNFEDINIFKDLIIMHNKFNLNFEYSSKNSSRLNIFSTEIFKSIYISLEDYYNDDLDIQLNILDLHAGLINNKKIYYAVNVASCINCR